jgi:hypothetical protein
MVVGKGYSAQTSFNAFIDELFCPSLPGTIYLLGCRGSAGCRVVLSYAERALAGPIRIARRVHLKVAFSPAGVRHFAPSSSNRRTISDTAPRK